MVSDNMRVQGRWGVLALPIFLPGLNDRTRNEQATRAEEQGRQSLQRSSLRPWERKAIRIGWMGFAVLVAAYFISAWLS